MDHAPVIVASSPPWTGVSRRKEWILLVMDKKEVFDRLLHACLDEARHYASPLRRGMCVVRSMVIARVICSCKGCRSPKSLSCVT
jgi:hypothetical protein